MNLMQRLPKNSGLMLLSLGLSIVLWLFVNYDRDSETELTIPVHLTNIASGLVVANQPSARLNVRVAGPRIQLMRMRPEGLVVFLDLKNIREGAVTFTELDKAVPVRREIRVTRVYPSAIEVTLKKR